MQKDHRVEEGHNKVEDDRERHGILNNHSISQNTFK